MLVPTAAHVRRAVASAVILLVVLLLGATPAAAHAQLLATDPTDGSVIPDAPDGITLQFSEPVSVQADGVRVLDGRGERVDLGQTAAEGPTVTAPLVDDLDDGTYVAAFRIVSADGHPIRGAVTFSVGAPSQVADDLADQAFGAGDDRRYEQLAALLRVIAYLGSLGAAGYVLVGGALRLPDDPSPLGPRVTGALVAALLALLALVPLQGALATGRGIGAIFDDGVLRAALGDGHGIQLLIVTAGLLAMVITAGLPFEGAVRTLARGGAVVAPLGFVAAGHTRSMSPALLGFAADAVHLAAATVWFGGLIAMTVAVVRRRRDGAPLGAAEAVARFSTWAMGAAGAVIGAGLVLTWIEVRSLEGLTGTTYGRLLLAKFGLVAVVLALAGWNRFRLVPRVAAAAIREPAVDDAAGWRALLASARIEVAVLVVVIGITGVVVNVPPAKDAIAGGPVTVEAPLGEGTLEVTVDPARPGGNDIHLYLFDAEGRPDDSYEEGASVRLELPEQGVGPIDREPVRVGPGHLQLVAVNLPLAGEWTITLTVKPDRFTEQTAPVVVPVR